MPILGSSQVPAKGTDTDLKLTCLILFGWPAKGESSVSCGQCAIRGVGIEFTKYPISETLQVSLHLNSKPKNSLLTFALCQRLLIIFTGVKLCGAVVTTLAVVSLIVIPAHADELSLLVNGKAVHFNVPEGDSYNEKNWGLGVQYDFDRTSKQHNAEKFSNWITFLNASAFQDSNDNRSWYAGGGLMRRYRPFSNKEVHVDLGVVGFLMQRKDFHDGHLFPGVLPAASFGTDRIALNVTYVPKVDPKMVPLVFFQLKVGLRQFLKN